MTEKTEHAVVHVTVSHPDKLVGFFVAGGNCEHAKELYEREIHQPTTVTDEDLAIQIMADGREIMVAAGYTCGEVMTQPKYKWVEMILERPLTAEEIEVENTDD